ncbi:hypothetical protein HV458_18370 [Bacillus sporothermodurans]|nr:hypothetical protein [Heyndrickxia sporothermodurans]
MQLEELIIIISNEFKSFDQETNFSTLTIAEKFIKEELFYFKSIYPAINSKIPKLKYKQMILLLFNDFHKNIII